MSKPIIYKFDIHRHNSAKAGLEKELHKVMNAFYLRHGIIPDSNNAHHQYAEKMLSALVTGGMLNWQFNWTESNLNPYSDLSFSWKEYELNPYSDLSFFVRSVEVNPYSDL